MLDKHSASVGEERNSRKNPLDDPAAQALVDAAQAVWIAKGKKLRRLTAEETSLDDLKGPTGNFRAPMVRIGDTLLVGFNAESLEELVAS